MLTKALEADLQKAEINDPLISVVMTSYNHRDYIGQAIESILGQDFNDFELIIVDDNSSDDSQSLIREYELKDKRIRAIYRHVNFGSYVLNTNFAVSFARADYIVLAQCDDFAQPSQLRELYNARLANSQCKVVFSASNMIDSLGNKLDVDLNFRSRNFKKFVCGNNILPKKVATKFLMKECIIPNLSAAMIDKSLFESVGGLSQSYKVLADWDFWLKCVALSDIYYIPNPLNNFRQHQSTIRSTIKIETQLNELYFMFRQYKADLYFTSRLILYSSVANIFWGFVLPEMNHRYLEILKLLLKSYRFSFLEPVFILVSLIKRTILKWIRCFL